ncbi:hypothetical protein KJ068_02390 [bacterium]|nr:hypothetical protein [bacterium]
MLAIVECRLRIDDRGKPLTEPVEVNDLCHCGMPIADCGLNAKLPSGFSICNSEFLIPVFKNPPYRLGQFQQGGSYAPSGSYTHISIPREQLPKGGVSKLGFH